MTDAHGCHTVATVELGIRWRVLWIMLDCMCRHWSRINTDWLNLRGQNRLTVERLRPILGEG